MGIAIHNLTVSYRRRPAVHHLDMQFADGAMWAIFSQRRGQIYLAEKPDGAD